MSQNSLILPTTGTVSGLAQTQNINNALDSLNTLNSGASAPSTISAGMLWHDTSNNLIKIRDQANSAWITIGTLDETGKNSIPYNVMSASAGGYINKIRNPGMTIASRGASGTITAGSPAYSLDGWIVSATGANITWSQSGTLGFPSAKSINIVGNTGVTNSKIYQRIESNVVGYIDGQQVTIQASITNNTGASITPNLIVDHANATDNFGAITNDLNVSLQSIANGATTKVAYTYTAAANSYNGLQISFDFGSTLNSVAKNASVSNVDVRVTPGVTSGLNSSPPPVEIIDITAEKLRCARYLPAFASAGTSSPIPSVGVTSATATINNIFVVFPVPTRVAVTGVTVSAASHFNTTDNVVYDLAASAIAIGTSSSTIQALIAVTQSGVGTTIGRGATLKFNNASGLMIFTGAEL
ncbi:MAG: hypothetical protein WCL30_02505 [Pseudomonadota bacterium]